MTAYRFNLAVKSGKFICLYLFGAQGTPQRSGNSNGRCLTNNKILYPLRYILIGLTIEIHDLNRQFSLIQHAYNAVLPFDSGYHVLSLLLIYIILKQSPYICQSTKNMTK